MSNNSISKQNHLKRKISRIDNIKKHKFSKRDNNHSMNNPPLRNSREPAVARREKVPWRRRGQRPKGRELGRA